MHSKFISSTDTLSGLRGPSFGTLGRSDSLHCADWHSLKIQSFPAAPNLSLTVLCRSSEGLHMERSFGLLLVRVKSHRAAVCITSESFFKPKEILSTDWAGFSGPQCSSWRTVNRRTHPRSLRGNGSQSYISRKRLSFHHSLQCRCIQTWAHPLIQL